MYASVTTPGKDLVMNGRHMVILVLSTVDISLSLLQDVPDS